MEMDQGQGGLINSITGFAMRQASRRSFIKWATKAGVALAASMAAGIELFKGTADAFINCSQYYPGCSGRCSCGTSQCQDPSDHDWYYCEGNCVGGCGEGPTYYSVYVYWTWVPDLHQCVVFKTCDNC